MRLLDLFRELFVLKSETFDCLSVLMHQSLKSKSMLFLHVSNCDTKIIIGPVGSHELSLQLVDLTLVVFIHQ